MTKQHKVSQAVFNAVRECVREAHPTPVTDIVINSIVARRFITDAKPRTKYVTPQKVLDLLPTKATASYSSETSFRGLFPQVYAASRDGRISREEYRQFKNYVTMLTRFCCKAAGFVPGQSATEIGFQRIRNAIMQLAQLDKKIFFVNGRPRYPQNHIEDRLVRAHIYSSRSWAQTKARMAKETEEFENAIANGNGTTSGTANGTVSGNGTRGGTSSTTNTGNDNSNNNNNSTTSASSRGTSAGVQTPQAAATPDHHGSEDDYNSDDYGMSDDSMDFSDDSFDDTNDHAFQARDEHRFLHRMDGQRGHQGHHRHHDFFDRRFDSDDDDDDDSLDSFY